MVIGLWHTYDSNFSSLSLFWVCKEHPYPLSPDLGFWRILEAPDWGLASWSLFGNGHWSLISPWSKFWLSIFILKVQRTSMSFKSSFGALEDAEGSWLGFSILIFIWIWSWVSDWALAFGLGSYFWLWLWFLLSRVKKICCLPWRVWAGSGSDGFGFGWVWDLARLMISQS